MIAFVKLFAVFAIVAGMLLFAAQKSMECRGMGGVLVHWRCIDKQAIK